MAARSITTGVDRAAEWRALPALVLLGLVTAADAASVKGWVEAKEKKCEHDQEIRNVRYRAECIGYKLVPMKTAR
jgi:hypothetical protein